MLTLQRRAESSRRVRQGSYAQAPEKRLVTRLTETQPHAAEASVGCPREHHFLVTESATSAVLARPARFV